MNVLFKEELNKLFEEAKACDQSVNLSTKRYECYIYKGVQIIKDDTSIKIYSPKGMDFYDEVSTDFYLLFMDGWKIGVYRLTLKKYELSLLRIEKKIADEMNNKVSLKVIEQLRSRRLNIMNKFYSIRTKLNQQL
tara:strand:+ start:614 stop:1018 length:405 start_codon:yes stop_codon:yes gene_type:complete